MLWNPHGLPRTTSPHPFERLTGIMWRRAARASSLYRLRVERFDMFPEGVTRGGVRSGIRLSVAGDAGAYCR